MASQHSVPLLRGSGSVASPRRGRRVAVVALVSAACGRGGARRRARPRRRQRPCKTVTLAATPIEDASEFIATLRSLRSTTVQPEVEGIVTRIFVKSGDRVQRRHAARPDQSGQAAGRRVERRSQPRRHRSRRRSTGGSRRSDWSRSSRPARSARPSSIRRRTRCAPPKRGSRRSTRRCAKDASSSQFYRVVAPQAGTVGDIAVRVGDRVTNSTDDHDHRRRAGARGLHPGSARPLAAARASAFRCSCSTRTARSSPPIPISFVAAARRRCDADRARQEPPAQASRRRCASCSSSARASSGAACRA